MLLANLSGDERARYVQEMFGRISRRYDLMNRLMTLGQDVHWRAEVIRLATLPSGGKILDLGAGTGDLACTALHQKPDCLSVAVDFTFEMMQVGRSRLDPDSPLVRRLNWAAADAHHLPFPGESFDAVISGFLLRNVSDVRWCLAEQQRVLKPGGVIVALDTTPPSLTLLTPLVRFHLHAVIPNLGRMVTGEKDAYHYLPDSTESFLQPEQLAERMQAAGFREVRFRRLMFGSVAIHWGYKPRGRA